ncbi:MAG: type IV secretory system conjugative DNA transfer family protein [Blastocatellia bacterium]
MSAIREENSNEIVRCPKPKLIVADKTAFLNELKGCKSSLFCIATKKETLEALETIANKNEAEVWRYSLTDVENSRKDFNWIKLCGDERMAWLVANTILRSQVTSKPDQFGDDPNKEAELKTLFLAAMLADVASCQEPEALKTYKFRDESISKGYSIEKVQADLYNSKSEVAREYAKSFTVNTYVNDWLRFRLDCLTNDLNWLVAEEFREFIAVNNQQSPDFSKLRNNNVIAYLDLTDLEGKDTTPLSSLFFTIALEQLEKSDNTNTAYIFVDELTNIGQIRSLPTYMGLIRRFAIGLVLATSDLDKLAMIYGLDNAKVIIGNGLGLSSLDEIERIYSSSNPTNLENLEFGGK